MNVIHIDRKAPMEGNVTITGGKTEGGYPFHVKEIIENGFAIGEVQIPGGEWIEITWDGEGNVFGIGGWLGNLHNLCKVPKHVAEPPKLFGIDPESARLVEVNSEFPTLTLEKVLEASKVAMTPEAYEALAATMKQPKGGHEGEFQPMKTVAGYECVILEHKQFGMAAGVVQLPNGELITTEWDADGDDTGGRPKFKLVGKIGAS